MSQALIAILDVGKTNKKLFLFDQQYKMVWEKAYAFPETKDEDGYPCEDLERLNQWVGESCRELRQEAGNAVKAINFSAYGASFVHIGEDGRSGGPLYNYLKPYPADLQNRFYHDYGGEPTFSMLTASPVLGSLNSGMQLYRLKKQRAEWYEGIRYSLHLPQYLSYLLTGQACSDITSIGCHTNLWNFPQNNYHEWVYREGIIEKLAPIAASDKVYPARQPWEGIVAGIGLHDSSAAMIPYLESYREPFVLISTGTWCISMNPFNESPLTLAELQKDCLCYMTYQGRPVKSSRLFAGYDHEQQVKRLADRFNKSPDYYNTVLYNPARIVRLRQRYEQLADPEKAPLVHASVFETRELSAFDSYEDAYCQLIMDIMSQQVASTNTVLQGTKVKRIFVDGGFGKNPVYMNLLASAFPHIEVFAASIPQASAMGAALAIHRSWNDQPLPGDLVEIVPF
ncbi:MAG: FGGY family carbohydrate kinase [Puia sp.]|nr:FGGY family carbohydrate kinase [Puia sp.]